MKASLRKRVHEFLDKQPPNISALVKELKDKEFRDAFLRIYVLASVSYQIKALRESRSMTQKQLAAKLGISQSEIARLESGRATPRISTLTQIAEVFDVALVIRFVGWSELLGGMATPFVAPVPFDEDVALKNMANPEKDSPK